MPAEPTAAARLSDAPELLTWSSCPQAELEALNAAYGSAAAAAARSIGADPGLHFDVFDPRASEPLFWPERIPDAAERLRRLAQAQGACADTERVLLFSGGELRLSVDDPSELHHHAAALADAIAMLDEIAPAACAFTLAMTRRIEVGRDHDRPAFWSSTPERFHYGTRLWNLGGEDVAREQLADALLHEAIHSWLDLDCLLRSRGLRAGGPWMPDDLLCDGESRVTSPWTGAPLSVPIFVHACFVWYGLLHLWAAACGGASASRQAKALLRRAWKGFLLRPERELVPFAPELAPDIVRSTSAMIERVAVASAAELALT